MNKTRLVPLLVLCSMLFVSLVRADIPPPPPQINSGYAVTTDAFKVIVYVGESVTAYAYTTHSGIETVTFIWMPPEGGEEAKTADGPYDMPHDPTGSLDGTPYYAVESDPFLIDVVGDWGVQVVFKDTGGNIRGPYPLEPNEYNAIKATSFHSVPELPLGTLTATLVMLSVLALYALKPKVLTKYL